MKFLLTTFFCALLCTAQAQKSTAVKTTNIEQMQNYSHSFFVDLKVGNTMRIDVYDRYGPQLHYNIDSLVGIAISAYSLIKDSLESEYYARTMELKLYDTLLRSISWGATPPKSRRILMYDSTSTAVKFMQDTVFIRVYQILPAIGTDIPAFLNITMCLNSLSNLEDLKSKNFNSIFDSLDAYSMRRWYVGNNNRWWLKTDPSVQVIRAYDETKLQRRFGHYLSFSVQNYRDHFVPSVNAGIGTVTEQNFIREEIYAGYEIDFTFQNDADGKAITCANHFATLMYKTTNLNRERNHIIGVFPNLKLGYLVKRKGDVIDKHSFKLGVCQFAIGENGLHIEPTFYFNNFFKNISPSFRITQSF